MGDTIIDRRGADVTGLTGLTGEPEGCQRASPPGSGELSVRQELLALEAALKRPFPVEELRWRVGAMTADRKKGQALPYLTARAVQDRLDEVLGISGWQSRFTCHANGSVECQLSLCIGGAWLTRSDVGGQSEQPDEGDRVKASYSDALKRAAVQWGIGRYLYGVTPEWVPLDDRKRFITQPCLPGMTPRKAPAPARSAPARSAPARSIPAGSQTGSQAVASAPTKAAPAGSKKRLPANGGELLSRLIRHDQQLADEGFCAANELLNFLRQAGSERYGSDISHWHSPEAIQFAADRVKEFEKRQPAGVA